MRGTFVQSGRAVFVHRTGSAGAGEPSAEKDPETRTRCARQADAWPGEAVRERRPPLDSARAVIECAAASSVLRRPVGTNTSSWSSWTTISCTAGS